MNELQKAIWTLAAATLVLYLFVGGFAVYVFVDASRTHDALCTFRGDLENRVAQSRKYLAETPNAIPGITPAQIRSSLDSQQHTIDALSTLDCPR